MSAEDATFLLSVTFDRATRDAAPCDLPGIRRAFRRAMRAAGNGDVRPAVLLSYRYP